MISVYPCQKLQPKEILHCSKLLQNIKIKILCDIRLYTRKILRSRAIACFDTSAILYLSMQGQQLHPILCISKWHSLPEKTWICTVLQDLENHSKIAESWIWCTTQVFSSFFNTCQINQGFSCILHFHGHHQNRVIQSCFIYELVTSTKLAFLSLLNSRCKYSPMPSEFQFKEPPPLALGIPKSRSSWCMDIFWNCPI